MQPKRRKLEREIERELGVYCKKQGWLYYKFRSPSNSGVADRIVVTEKGRVIFLELKREGNKPTTLQAKFIMDILDHGGIADWKDTLKSAIEFIHENNK